MSFQDFTKSKYFVVFLFLILILVFTAMSKEAYRYYKIGQEIRGLEKKIEDLKNSNEELAKLREYFTSKEFLEDEARRKLNMTKEGESVIIISDSIASEEDAQQEQQIKVPNLKLWLEYFFGGRQK
jgi:cell division protein FtsB